jgi:hypothetical protein
MADLGSTDANAVLERRRLTESGKMRSALGHKISTQTWKIYYASRVSGSKVLLTLGSAGPDHSNEVTSVSPSSSGTRGT